MLVADKGDNLSVLSQGLEGAGYGIHAFASPIAAVDHILNGCDDCGVMVSDIWMPMMSGMELVRRIKKRVPEMKIVLMTTFEIRKSESKMVLPNLQVDYFIIKPVQLTDLIATLLKFQLSSYLKSTT